MACVFTNYLNQQLLTDALASVTSGDFAGILKVAKAVLFTNNIIPTATTLYADLTLPTYAGYAAQVCTFGAAYRRNEGGFATNSLFLKWQMSDAVVPSIIYGVGITDGGGTPKLLSCELFADGPITLLDALDAFYTSTQIAIGGPDSGTMEVTN